MATKKKRSRPPAKRAAATATTGGGANLDRRERKEEARRAREAERKRSARLRGDPASTDLRDRGRRAAGRPVVPHQGRRRQAALGRRRRGCASGGMLRGADAGGVGARWSAPGIGPGLHVSGSSRDLGLPRPRAPAPDPPRVHHAPCGRRKPFTRWSTAP